MKLTLNNKKSILNDLSPEKKAEIERLIGSIDHSTLSKKEQLKNLKKQLTSTDYQVIKCYEYSLAGLALPYDITALHEEREALRVQIRELEEE